MADKKSFVLYYSMIRQVELLDDHQAANLLRAILSTGGVCDRPDLDPLTEMAFIPIERELEENAARWEETREGRRKAANSRWEKERKNNAKNANHANAQNALQDDNAKNANHANDAVDVDVAVDVDDDVDVAVVNNNTLAQNEQRITDDDAASTPCSSDDEPEQSAHASGHANNGRPAQPSKKAVDEHFETLWALFPNKRGKNQVSEKTRRKLLAVSVDTMRIAVQRYMAEFDAAPPDRQMLYGSTWFNGRYADYASDDYEPLPQRQHSSVRSRSTTFRPAGEVRDWSGLEE